MTDNHSYNTPTAGTGDWHVPLNDNFERLDADVEIRDVEADRTAYVAKAGAKFYATDTGAAYIGDGTDWQKLATTGQDPEFTSLRATERIEAPTVVSTATGTTVWNAYQHSIPTGTATTVEFETVEDDQRNQWDDTNHEIVVSEPGNYLVFGGLSWLDEPSPGTNHWFTIRKNGNIGVAEDFDEGTADTTLQASRPVLDVNAGDAFHLEVEQYEGDPLRIGGNRTSTYLSVVQI